MDATIKRILGEHVSSDVSFRSGYSVEEKSEVQIGNKIKEMCESLYPRVETDSIARNAVFKIWNQANQLIELHSKT